MLQKLKMQQNVTKFLKSIEMLQHLKTIFPNVAKSKKIHTNAYNFKKTKKNKKTLESCQMLQSI